jgi:hypothetical protein
MDGVATRSTMWIMPEVAAAHLVVTGMNAIAVHVPAICEIAAALGGSTRIGIRVTSARADTDRCVDIEAGADPNTEVESRQADDANTEGERGHVDFTDRQRDPAHRRIGDHHARIEIRENDQRRSVHGTNHRDRHRRDPAPRSAHVYPSAEMEWSPTPGGVIDPVPAPRLDPGPMSVAIGSPIRDQTRRKPDRAVGANVAPHAKVPAQVFVAGNVAGDVIGGDGGHFTRIAKLAKRVELIGRRDGCRIQVRVLRARGRHLRTHVHRRGLVADVDLGVAFAHGGDGGIAVLIHVHAIIAVAEQREGELGSIDLEALARSQRVQPDVQRSGGDLNLRHVVVQVQEREIGTAGNPHFGIVGLQFGHAVLLRPDMVAIGDRMVEFGWNPVVDAGGLKGNRSG